ncbi:MAG: hypothetical protein ATN35_01765 [Epulopiscium sp. Nele67-Bin004]|nr:MAG: hypothetical protein ATN35_01765 [Epulopiscium sp. Nele67-Bin004]
MIRVCENDKEFLELTKEGNSLNIIYGASELGQSVYKANIMRVDYFIDRGASEIQYIDEVPVITIEELGGGAIVDDVTQINMIIGAVSKKSTDIMIGTLEVYSDIKINIVTLYNAKVNSYNIKAEYFIGGMRDWRKNWEVYSKEYEELLDKYEDLWADEKSKQLFKGLLTYINTGEPKEAYKHLDLDIPQYFDQEIINLTNEEVFLDVGAGNRDTLTIFRNITNNQFKQVICFEPQPERIKVIENYIEENQLTNVRVINKGAYNKQGSLYFYINEQNPGASRINHNGTKNENLPEHFTEITIEVDAIDNICKDIEVTYIKMDIEGAEQYALEGAKETILRDKPKLVICLYHSIDDFMKLPFQIKELNPDYRLYLRGYSQKLNEIVCYAV